LPGPLETEIGSVKQTFHTISYAGLLGVVCALFLTGAGQFAAPYRRANERAEEVRNILEVLGVPFERDAPAERLLATFEEKVRIEEPEGRTLYVALGQGGRPKAVAVPFAGKGLWGPIRGLLALDPDMRTVRGIAFYQQEETPGLGGEIASQWFRQQFEGKRIVNAEGEPGIRIRPGGAAGGPNEVDAITGATMTCEKVQKMLNAAIDSIVREG
jgi:Na+-transporting NADH:ubiquinone oxidoreductase subunit C